MVLSVFLGVWSGDKLRRIKIDDVNLESNVEILKAHLTKEFGSQAFDLTYCGLSMEDNKPLSTYGVTAGSTIHVTEPLTPKISQEPKLTKVTEAVIQEFISSYRKFRTSPSFRSTLHRLENPSELDKVIAAVPGLNQNPIAIAFISSPNLFSQMEDPKTCWQIVEREPLILEAARFIVTDFHNTTGLNTGPSLNLPPTSGHSYSLDALSDDDDEMEGEGSSSSLGAITAEHLAAALAAAAAPTPRITQEMLQQALSPSVGTSRYASQLQQMRELGLNDENRNLRALTAASGDLQGAIDLVFSGALDD
ncbi:hypothetical protein ABEB36_000991 [Hypothenemus hampei]|uniref:Ubiquitin-like protein 7 n=1 Tax=Hypothenemus hampei TaxID=57062 RepID=A0ABD1FD67_HYPHA